MTPHTTPALEVRPARPEDRALVEAMMVPYLRGFGAEGPYPGLERYGSDARCAAFLLWLDGAAAGFALLEQVDAGTTELVEFYVAAQHRRQGCGRRAAEAVFALRPGRWRVGVRQDNGPALVFWRAVLAGKPGLTVREHARPPAWIYEFDASSAAASAEEHSMRIAIVTGGSKGLGAALCLLLRRAGFRVFEFSRTAPHVFSHHLDLADPATAVTAVSRVLAGIDPARCAEVLVFNNAGRLDPIGPVWAKPVDEVLAHLNVNLSSAILVLGEVMRHFRDSPGRKLLVNVSSGAALKAYAGWSLYGTAKAGMEAFIRGLAVEERHQPRPFVAVSVDPGVIDTGMQALIRDTSAQDFPEVLRFVRRYEAGGLVPADTVAAAILELVARDDLESGARYDAPLAAA